MSRRHEYSQHFLRSPAVVATLIGHSNLRKKDVVYDLGAGSGVITSVLARRVAKVIAVEVEPRALRLLRQNVGDLEHVTIREKDIINVSPTEERYKIFANPPFAIISPLIARFTALDRPPAAMYLITQRQFAQKTVPSDRHFTSALGTEIAPWYEARIRMPLKRSDFTPPPAVDTVLLELKRRETPLLHARERQSYARFIQRCYADRRYYDKVCAHTKIEVRACRASEVELATWIALYRELHSAA